MRLRVPPSALRPTDKQTAKQPSIQTHTRFRSSIQSNGLVSTCGENGNLAKEPVRATARVLDWDAIEDADVCPPTDTYDLVIGAEIVHEMSHAAGVIKTLRYYLAPGVCARTHREEGVGVRVLACESLRIDRRKGDYHQRSTKKSLRGRGISGLFPEM